jgi:hypothetical protein
MKAAWAMMIAAGMAATASQTTWAEDTGAGKPPPPGPRPERGEFAQRFKEMDKDADGKVTWDEFKAFHDAKLRERFERMDTNKDGVLSRDDRRDHENRPGKGPGADAPTPPDKP